MVEELGNEDEVEDPNVSNLGDLFIESSNAPRTETQQAPKKRSRDTEVRGEPSKKKSTWIKTGKNWAILEPIWPASERPEALRDPERIEAQSIGDLMQLHKVYQKKEKQEQGTAIGRATKDTKPPTTQFKAAEDDSDKTLHDARFQRMPISKPKH